MVGTNDHTKMRVRRWACGQFGRPSGHLFLCVLNLLGSNQHTIRRFLTQSENLIPRILGDAHGIAHIGKNLRNHGVALELSFGECSQVHVFGLLGKLLLDITYPVSHEGSAGRLEEICMRHCPPIILADEKFHQLPRRIGMFRAGIDAKSIRRRQGHFPQRARREWCDTNAERSA